MPPRYPKEFRDDVVRVALNRDPDVTLAQIAKDFGIHVGTLDKWLREERVEPQGLGHPRRAPVGNCDVDRAYLPSTSQSGSAGAFDADRIRDHHEQTGRTRCLTNLSPKRASDPYFPKKVVALTAADVKRVADGYESVSSYVATIPFDPAMVDGILCWCALRPTKQRAWLAAGTAVTRGSKALRSSWRLPQSGTRRLKILP